MAEGRASFIFKKVSGALFNSLLGLPKCRQIHSVTLANVQPIPHDPRLGWNEGHSSFRDIPQLFIVPMRAHDSTRGMRSRSQQQVPNLGRHHIGQECMTKPSPLSKFLNAVIEDICKVPGSLL